MKLIKLSIHNLASIEDAVIDFDNGPLAEDSRFLICGPTGSGKTTLLDALCLALYGTTPRLNSTRNESYVDPYDSFVLSGKREDIKIADPRMLMRRGSLNCWVELVFTDKDDHPLKSLWSCSRAHNKSTGSVKAAEWVLMEGNDDRLLSSKKTEVEHLITERIGMNFDQFCRTTMLAQGDFTKFLKSQDNEKSEILEKLTGTELFSTIGSRIYQRKVDKDQVLKQIKSRLEGVQLLTEEERNLCTETLKQLKDQIQVLNGEEKTLQDRITWMNQWRSYTQEVGLSRTLLQTLQEKVKLETYQTEEQRLADWDRTATPREWAKSLRVALQTLQQKEEEAKTLGRTYQQLCAGLLALEQQYAEAAARKQKILAYINKEKPFEETYRQIGVIESLASQRKDVSLQLAHAEEAIAKHQLEVERLQPLLAQDQQSVLQVKGQASAKQQEYEAADAKLQAFHYPQLLNEKNTLEQERNNWKDYRTLVEKVEQAQRLTKDKQSALQGLRSKLSEEQLQSEALVKEENILLQQVNRQQQLYDKQKLACEDLMKEYRSQLHEGDVCPLCGQSITHLTTDEHFVSILRPVEELLADMQQKRQMAQKASSDQQALCKAHELEAERLTQEWQLAKNQEDAILIDIQQHPLFATHPLKEGLLAEMDKQLELFVQQLIVFDAKLKEVGKQQELVSALQKEKGLIEKQLQSADERAKLTEKELTNVQKLLVGQQSLQSSTQKTLQENSAQLSKYLRMERLEQEGEAYINALQKGASLYQKAHDTLDDVEKKILNFGTERSHIRSIQEAMLALRPEWKTLERHEAQLIDSLSTYWVKLQSRTAALQEVSQTARHQQQEADQQLDQYFQQEDAVTPSILQDLMTLTTEDMEKLRKSHQTLRDEVLQAQTRVDTALKHLAEHEAQRPEMEENLTLEHLSQQETAKKSELEAANQQWGKVQQSLEQDDANKKRFASICLELEQATQEFDRWAHLSNLFGSAKGDKFRNIAQSYVLEQLLVNANQYLHLFTDRYEMECQPGSLTILLRDKEAGGVLRPTSTISGGESFLISLSLALGLSSLSRSTFSMDTLFIDEGFGTLDSSYLSTVVDALERLHQIGGKKIGIISHVDSLKERLTTQIQVSRVNSTLSKVEVVSLI